MEVGLRVEPIPVLGGNVGWIQNWVRVPSFSVPVCSVLLETAGSSLHLVSLQVFISLTKSGVQKLIRRKVSGLSGTFPLFRLNKSNLTTHAGWEYWIYVLPYLWLEAFFDLSMSASWVMLKPVVAKPLLLILISGLAKISLVLLAKVLACKLSALSVGMKPPYPGMWWERGVVDSWVEIKVQDCDVWHRMRCTYCPWPTGGRSWSRWSGCGNVRRYFVWNHS